MALPNLCSFSSLEVSNAVCSLDDLNKKIRKPYTITKSPESWTEPEHDKFLEQEVSPRTSGRLYHSSGPLNGGQSCGFLTDSPPVSPTEIDDSKYSQLNTTTSNQYKASAVNGTGLGGGGKTLGKWLKDQREKRKRRRGHTTLSSMLPFQWQG